jgi:uncharacterized pyridoxamine 5'-phosphate oxidase family protein
MTRNELLFFLKKHRLGVLATTSPQSLPEAAVVGIAFTNDLEIIFDTIESTRKSQNLRRNPRIAFVVGWDEGITVQYEGIADEPKGPELERLKEVYFEVYPDGRERQSWPGLTYFRVRPIWAKYSNFAPPESIFEFSESDLFPRKVLF